MIGFGPILFAALLQAPQAVAADDPALAAAVERFYEMQEKEDVSGYLALWSTAAQRPSPAQLKYLFDSGDDRFSDIQITRVVADGNRMRVRVSARRERTVTPRVAGGAPRIVNSVLRVALTFEKEGGEWKLAREGLAADDIAAAMMDAATSEEREAMLAAEPDLVGLPLLAALARLGSTAAASQNYQRAQATFEELVSIARRTGHRKEEAEALQNIANALYFQRRFPEALAAYEQRLAIERERGDDAGMAAALAGIATIRYSFAEYGEALKRYRQALAIHERLDDVAGVAFTTLSIGNIAYLQGDFQAAIDAYRRSLELNRTMYNVDGESRAQEGLGLVLTAQGDFAGALEAFNGVLKDPRMRSYRGRLGAVGQNAGDVHFRLGNLDAAKAIYDESRAHFESLKDMPNVGRVLQSIALTELVAGRFIPAEDLYKRSESICTTAEDRECAARAMAGFAYAQAAQDKFWDAVASYRKTIAAFAGLEAQEEAARSEIGLSQALMGAGDVAAAVEAAIRARRTAVVIESDDVLWRALTAQARAVRKNGDKARALGIARAAVGVVDRLHTLALDKPGSRLPADAVAALATFAVLQAETGDAAGAFVTSEVLRSLDVRGGLATNERDIARGMTREEREEERALSAQLSTRLAQLNREKGLPKPDAERIAMLDQAVAEAMDARRTFLQRLFERLPDLRVWRGLSPPRVLADAAPLLDDETVLLSFVLDDDDVLVLLLAKRKPSASEESSGVEGSGVEGVDVGAYLAPARRRHVAERIAALQQPAALSDLAAWRKAASEVAALIPPAVATRLADASKVLIIPHDVFWRVPFEAMPSADGLLIDHATVSVGGSLDSLLRSFGPSAAAPDSMLVVGSPELTAARSDRLEQVAPSWPLRMREHADVEMKAASGVYPTERVTRLAGAAATEGAIRARAADAPIVHIAAPFRINAASPLFSPILLSLPEPAASAAPLPAAPREAPTPAPTPAPAGAQQVASAGSSVPTPAKRDPTDDGSLELREIMNLNLRARVVVLSDGAATSMRDGAAAADVLQWAWLAAGVPSLLVSRWTALQGSEPLVAEFHEQVREGAMPADALRAAQLAVRSTSATSAPIHWAGWMLVGP